MAPERPSHLPRRILSWPAQEEQRTRGTMSASTQDLVHAPGADQGNLSHSWANMEAKGLISNETGRIYRPPAWVRVSLALPEEALTDYEWVSEEGTYREWLIPAALLNAHAKLEPYDKWADEEAAEDETP